VIFSNEWNLMTFSGLLFCSALCAFFREWRLKIDYCNNKIFAFLLVESLMMFLWIRDFYFVV
jgi:hypothetical protein